jgi:hypothetical protein
MSYITPFLKLEKKYNLRNSFVLPFRRVGAVNLVFLEFLEVWGILVGAPSPNERMLTSSFFYLGGSPIPLAFFILAGVPTPLLDGWVI